MLRRFLLNLLACFLKSPKIRNKQIMEYLFKTKQLYTFYLNSSIDSDIILIQINAVSYTHLDVYKRQT